MNDQYIKELIDTLEQTKIIVEDGRELDYEAGIHALVECFTRHKRAGAQIFFIGNGGSSAIASHMTADFMKNGGMKTYSLYDNAVTTCMGNDYGYEYIFSRPLEFLGREGDLLVAVSSSGNSRNIINAINVTKEKRLPSLPLLVFCRITRQGSSVTSMSMCRVRNTVLWSQSTI